MLLYHPGQEYRIEDYTLIGNLVYDDIQTYARSRGSMSVSVVSITFLNTNASIRSSLIGTQYLGVVSAKDVSKDGSDLKSFIDLILRHFYLAAKVGLFIPLRDRYIHMRIILIGTQADYVGHQILRNCPGKMGSTFPCIHCDMSMMRYDVTGLCSLPVGSNCLERSIRLKHQPLSLHFLKPGSLLKYVSFLFLLGRDLGFDEEKVALYLKGFITLSSENEKEISGLMHFFKSINTKRLVFWLPPAVDVRANELVRINQLHTALTKMDGQMTTEPCLQENIGNLSYEEIAAFYNQFIQEYLGEENKPVSYSGVIKMDDYLMASKQHQSFLDCMHLYKNAFKSFVTFMTPLTMRSNCGQWETEFARKYIVFSNRIELSDTCFLIPSVVSEKASQRIAHLNKTGISWMTESAYELKTFNSETCEHDLILFFCFFDYVFQDSMSYPIIGFLSIIIHVMEAMYNEDGNMARMRRYQEILSFFLGCVENQVVPDKPTVSVHLLNHLYDTYCYGGPLYTLTNFITERLYRFIKRNAFANRYAVESVSKKANVLTVAAHMKGRKSDESDRCVHIIMEVDKSFKAEELKDVTKANFISDYLFSRNDRLSHETYVDAVYLNPELSPNDWLRASFPNISLVVLGQENIYSRAIVAGESVMAVTSLPNSIDDNWVSEHAASISFFRGYNRKLRFVLITGFLCTRVNGITFIQALCHSIETSSMSSYVESQHIGLVAKDPVDRRGVLIPLSRLHVNRTSSLLFDYGHRWALAARCLCIRQCKEISNSMNMCSFLAMEYNIHHLSNIIGKR